MFCGLLTGGVLLHAYQSDDMLHFDVSDTGVGIAAENIDHLFKPFNQINNETARKGTGLGATIAMKLSNMMGLNGLELTRNVRELE